MAERNNSDWLLHKIYRTGKLSNAIILVDKLNIASI